MESQPQNPVFTNNPEHFYPCTDSALRRFCSTNVPPLTICLIQDLDADFPCSQPQNHDFRDYGEL